MTTHTRSAHLVRSLLLSAAVGTAALGAPTRAEAACGSAAQVAADTWNEFHDEALTIGCAIGIFLPTASFAGCYAITSTYANLVTSMVSWWNDMANNGWATIGPRELVWTGYMDGLLRLGGERLFCSAAPSDKDTVEISIEKLDGKAETEIEICKMPKAGSAILTHSFTFANGSGNIGEVKQRTVSNAKDHIICVHFNNKSVFDNFKYTLDADKF